MTPLSPEAVAQMVADREAGTPGPWELCAHLADEKVDAGCGCGYRGVIYGPEHNTPFAVCQPGHQPAPEGQEGTEPARYHRKVELANARRIARLPDLEVAYLTLAAENATLRTYNTELCDNYNSQLVKLAQKADELATLRADYEDAFVRGMAHGQSVMPKGAFTVVDSPELATLRASEAAALERAEKAETALQFYADKSGWNQPPVKTREGLLSVEYENQASKIQRDRGAIARQALTPTADKE